MDNEPAEQQLTSSPATMTSAAPDSSNLMNANYMLAGGTHTIVCHAKVHKIN